MARGRSRKPRERGGGDVGHSRRKGRRDGDVRDSFRPQASQPSSHLPPMPPPSVRQDPRDARDSYVNNGGQQHRRAEGDSWRPDGPTGRGGDPGRRPFPRDDDRSGYDSFQPRPPQSDFTFRFDRPPGVSDLPPPPSFPPSSSTNYRSQDRRGPRRGDRRDGRGRGGRGGRRWQPVHPSERALVSGATSNLPEERLHNGDSGAKFRDLNELSDDDEQDMEISSRSSDSESAEPSRKKARTARNASPAAEAAPKWSNPDPYTALPCPDDSLKKKRDVVKLIRKARLEDNSGKLAASTEAENFISFDSSEDEEETSDSSSEPEQTVPPPPPPREPPPRDIPPPPPPPLAPHSLPPKPLPPAAGFVDSQPVSVPVPDRSGPLGSRKRTANDEIKPPNYSQLKKANMKPSKGVVLAYWQPKSGEDDCPWATVDHSATTDMAVRLHKELMDFYHFVKPQPFEQRIRDRLVDNIRTAMRRDGRNFASATVHPFGSFKSGLYLPTADMDLVVCSASFMRGGPPTYLSARSWLYKFQMFLVKQQIAEKQAIEIIAHARIPLVKFVDKATGLRVDVSFENLGGVNAIDTFLHWKEQYPAMPILVTIVKHFLLMRGLNEPVNGGIGGFSVICLVVSMLQLMPQVQSRSLKPEHHLGEMLMEFFDLYGRQFKYESNAISLTQPVGYLPKSSVQGFAYKNRDRFSIIDPNNPSNDISGGSSNTGAIREQFYRGFVLLRERMFDLAQDPDLKGGIIDVLMKGDYSSFRQQRSFLRHVHETTIGPC